MKKNTSKSVYSVESYDDTDRRKHKHTDRQYLRNYNLLRNYVEKDSTSAALKTSDIGTSFLSMVTWAYKTAQSPSVGVC